MVQNSLNHPAPLKPVPPAPSSCPMLKRRITMHQPGIEPGPHQWQRCIPSRDHWCHAKCLQPLCTVRQVAPPLPPAVKDLVSGISHGSGLVVEDIVATDMTRLNSWLMHCDAPLGHGAWAGSWVHWHERCGMTCRVFHHIYVTCSGKVESAHHTSSILAGCIQHLLPAPGRQAPVAKRVVGHAAGAPLFLLQ